ncbi:MAG: FAD binding domain-containing protein [Legionella sp.]|uniref:FAD binding domain-containing protein n=1 Tax=Legionella sp. TaxID=459 RepID=UPI00284F856B|nr:FAD binding domain-containing protein [Legionella sp.]
MSDTQKIGKRAIVIGGSLGGLFTGCLLQNMGWDVDIYERSPHELESRGGGIVLQPEVVRAFNLAGVQYQKPLGVIANERYYLDNNGNVTQAMVIHQILTSWGMLFGSMKRHFPAEQYHVAKKLVNFTQDKDTVTAFFEDGTSETGDMLIAADGAHSHVRALLFLGSKPHYAGYVAYRGLVDEKDLPNEATKIFTERFVFQQFPNSHILQYVVPGEDESLEPQKRRFNWVWYVNYDEEKELPTILTDKGGKRHNYSIPPGEMHPDVERNMRAYAAKTLSPPFQQLITATKEPFVQSILDYGAPKLVEGRVALLGDAGFIPRPHTAASTSKAAANAIDLAETLAKHNQEVLDALQAWEPSQMSLGHHLMQSGQTLGNRSQFSYGKGRHLDDTQES